MSRCAVSLATLNDTPLGRFTHDNVTISFNVSAFLYTSYLLYEPHGLSFRNFCLGFCCTYRTGTSWSRANFLNTRSAWVESWCTLTRLLNDRKGRIAGFLFSHSARLASCPVRISPNGPFSFHWSAVMVSTFSSPLRSSARFNATANDRSFSSSRSRSDSSSFVTSQMSYSPSSRFLNFCRLMKDMFF